VKRVVGQKEMRDEIAKAEAGARIERVECCPLCGSERLKSLRVANLVSRAGADRDTVVAALGGETFPLEQTIAVCEACDLVFQVQRPDERGLELLYERFATALGKETPTSEHMLEYVVKVNAKDYVQTVASSLEFLDRESLLDGVNSVLELRTFGGGLVGLLQERGVEYCEAAYIQDFDAQAARRIYGVEALEPFSFAHGLGPFRSRRERYDLIVAYEALTHSRSIPELLDWLADHLEPGGAAVLFREPDTPAYREYFPLEIVFNNFHMHLLDGTRLHALFEEDRRFHVEGRQERHPGFATPLYLTLVLRPALDATPEISVPGAGQSFDAAFYRSWIARDRSRLRRLGERTARMAARKGRAAVRGRRLARRVRQT